MRLCKHRKVLYCFYEIVLKSTRESKTSKACLLSSQHSYRPMRARAAAQLFYKMKWFNNLAFTTMDYKANGLKSGAELYYIRGQFNKTFTVVIHKCIYCFRG